MRIQPSLHPPLCIKWPAATTVNNVYHVG